MSLFFEYWQLLLPIAGIKEMHFARIIFPGSIEALFICEAGQKVRQRAKIKHRLAGNYALFRQHFGIIPIGTHHAAAFTIEGAVQR